MTHKKNYEYVKKWRENNKELNLQRASKYANKYYCFKRQQTLLFRIDPPYFFRVFLTIKNRLFFRDFLYIFIKIDLKKYLTNIYNDELFGTH